MEGKMALVVERALFALKSGVSRLDGAFTGGETASAPVMYGPRTNFMVAFDETVAGIELTTDFLFPSCKTKEHRPRP